MLDPNDLAPFLSMSPFRTSVPLTGDPTKEFQKIVEDALVQASDQNKGVVYTRVDDLGSVKEEFKKRFNDLTIVGITYSLEKYPAWFRLSENDVKKGLHKDYRDKAFHLVLFVYNSSYLAVISSDNKVDKSISELLLSHSPTSSSNIRFQYRKITWDQLQEALVHGPLRGLVLENGLPPHESVASVRSMSGPNLKFTLRASDAMYLGTTFVMQFRRYNEKQPRVGVSQKTLKVWTSKPKDMEGVGEHVNALFNLLHDSNWNTSTKFSVEETRGDENMDWLARPVPTSELKNATDLLFFIFMPREAWDIRYNHPELLPEDEERDIGYYEMLWEANGRFEIEKVKGGAGAELKAFYEDVLIAELDVIPIVRDQRIEWIITVTEDFGTPDSDEMIVLDKLLEDSYDRVHVRYGSGHIVKGNLVFVPNAKPVNNFPWHWEKFKPQIRLYEEFPKKPTSNGYATDYAKIGRNDDSSLFKFVVDRIDAIVNSTKSLLICDHGSGEVADFIHIDDDNKSPIISFIHVKRVPAEKDKATGNYKSIANREISIPAYYEVMGQGIKSLYYTDHDQLCAKLTDRLTTSLVTFTKGNPKVKKDDPADVIRYLNEFKGVCNYRLVIVQPHTRRKLWDSKMAKAQKTVKKTSGQYGQFLMFLSENIGACADRRVHLLLIGDDDR
jgi:hypothetical protein